MLSFTIRSAPNLACLIATTGLLISWATLPTAANAFSSNPTETVLVTGASGRTGSLVFDALSKHPDYLPKALVRSKKSAKSLQKKIPNIDLGQIIVSDITELENDQPLDIHAESLIICTSAVPTVDKLSLVLAFLKIPFNLIRRKKAVDFRTLKFVWKNKQYPELVDYEGQKKTIDLAKRVGVKQVIVVGSMGGTDPSNFLNQIGKKKDGSGNGDILLWKRKAEKYLVESGLDYTIIHPGGLIDTPAGKEKFILDVNDVLLENKKRSISRADVANLCVASLSVARGKKIAFDCITQEGKEGEEIPSAEKALADFLAEGKVYNYDI